MEAPPSLYMHLFLPESSLFWYKPSGCEKPAVVTFQQNMAEPHEATKELEDETVEKCLSFGEVHRCLAIVDPAPSCPDAAVRVFVEFGSIEAASKGMALCVYFVRLTQSSYRGAERAVFFGAKDHCTHIQRGKLL